MKAKRKLILVPFLSLVLPAGLQAADVLEPAATIVLPSVKARIKGVERLNDADNIRYDAGARKVYVGYGYGALRALDPATGDSSGDIRLAGHPESFQLETRGPRIFVNVPPARHVAVVDRAKQAVVATWDVPGAESNYPMALDEPGRRLFVGARRPAVLLVYDIDSGKVVAK